MKKRKFTLLITIIFIVLFLISCSNNLVSEPQGVHSPVTISQPPTIAPTTSLSITSTSTPTTKPTLTPTSIPSVYFKCHNNNNIIFTQVAGSSGLWLIQDEKIFNENDTLNLFKSWFSQLSIADLDYITTEVTQNDLSNMPEYTEYIILLTALPEDNVYLYGCSQGIIIRVNDYFQLFDLAYTSPMGILPVICYSNYDGDGQKELAISLHLGTGTGVSVEYLYLIEIDENGKMQAIEFTSEQYIPLLENSITATCNNNLLQFYINGEAVGESINISIIIEDLGYYKDISFGSQISFSFTNDAITISAIPGLCLIDLIFPLFDYMPMITAKVNLEDNIFTLSDFKYDIIH